MLGGLLLGLLGTGSSLVVLPALSLIFPYLLKTPIAIKMAVGTCMATIAVGAIAAAFSYGKEEQASHPLLLMSCSMYLLGAFLGPWITHGLPVKALHIYIGIILLINGLYVLFNTFHHQETEALKAYSVPEVLGVSFIVALLSSASGVASGLFMIPYLARFIPYRQAVVTAVVGAAFYATVGALSYVFMGATHPSLLPPHSWGYVYWPAFLIMAVSIAIFSPLGVWLSKKIEILW